MNQPETCITTPDDSSKMAREAVPPPAQPKMAFPGPADDQTGVRPDGWTPAPQRGELYGMPLAWRGLHLFGVALGLAAIWYIAAWIGYGRQPMTIPHIKLSIGNAVNPILPPLWLLAVLGLLALISIVMMFVGTQDVISRLKTWKR